MQKDTKKIVLTVLTIIIAVAMTIISLISDKPVENLLAKPDYYISTKVLQPTNCSASNYTFCRAKNCSQSPENSQVSHASRIFHVTSNS